MSSTTFRPAWWLPGPHLQTLAARLLRSWLRIEYRRERLELDDGDFLDLDWVSDEGSDSHDRPVVIVLHGLEGSADSGYARQLYRELSAHGLQAVGLNFRGCSGEPNRLHRAYHSGETGDLDYVVRLLRARYPGRPLGAVGVSLGGNVLLKYLGEKGARQGGQGGWGGGWTDEEMEEMKGKGGKEMSTAAAAESAGPPGGAEGPGVTAAVALSVPYNLSAGADYIERGFSKTYRAFLVRKLQRKVRAKAGLLNDKVDVARALAARTFREFDQAVIVPIHGFEDAEDYYQRSSSAQFLESIATPTLLIHSLDDPFLPPAAVPTGIEVKNPHVRTEFTRRGGHVGFVGGQPWAPVFWGESLAAEFLAAQLNGAG
jgi:predicted alpha/beta-fold hydrolase